MKVLLALCILLISLNSLAQQEKQAKIKKGAWISELFLNESDGLPFNMQVGKDNQLIIKNGEEAIVLNAPTMVNDSFHVRFPYFNSELIFALSGKCKMEGYWVNYNKGRNYKIPFESNRSKANRFHKVSKKTDGSYVGGKWEVTFEPNTESAYPAVGIIEQKEGENRLTGTFLTETGDYRFLEGNCTEDSVFLSCFDGSHAFLFKARIANDSLYGQFFSGSHWKSDWFAKRNENYQLTSPEDLTYVVDSNKLMFSLNTLDGAAYSFPNKELDGKVVILQIMGSWCPNCLDETHYYKGLYEMYHDRGLEIISIAYEAGKTFDDYVANVNRLKDKLDLKFTFLIGGSASKGLASEHFKVLNEVISFPTSIFIGRDGEIKRVHTGFNGPGTGSYYYEYIEKTNALVESLLSQ